MTCNCAACDVIEGAQLLSISSAAVWEVYPGSTGKAAFGPSAVSTA